MPVRAFFVHAKAHTANVAVSTLLPMRPDLVIYGARQAKSQLSDPADYSARDMRGTEIPQSEFLGLSAQACTPCNLRVCRPGQQEAHTEQRAV
jgi:hypothetical protein